MFATYEFGDYLVWTMAPARPVFIDGRGELYEREGVLADYLEVAGVRPHALEVLRAHGVQSCLVRQGEPLITLLAALPEWKRIYADDLSVLFVRTETASSPAASISYPTKPFGIRTYEKLAHNSFRIRTSQTKDLNSFRIRTYEKTGEGG